MILRVLAAVLALFGVASAAAVEVEGVLLPDTLTIQDRSLVLNGSGVRTKFRISIYAGGLYVTQRTSDPQAIIDADEPMAVRMHMIYGRLTGAQMVEAIDQGFAKATGGHVEPFADELEMLLSSLERVKADDVVDIYYVPGDGIGVLLNGEFKGNAGGLDFKKAVFTIWLGPDPVHKRLKAGMLGG